MSRYTRKKSKTILSCTHELQSFHQFSGQCWSDSAANLLFFAAGVGGKVQEVLQDPEVGERLESWLRSKETFEKIADTYREDLRRNEPDLTYFTDDEYYNIFIPAVKEYVKCLQLRYFNMRSITGDTPLTKRRASCVYSLCKEEKGALAAEVLTPKEQRFISLSKADRRSLERRMKEMSQLKVDIDTLSEHDLVGKDVKGYNNIRFAKVIEILLDFFTGGNVMSVINAKMLTSGIIKSPLNFIIRTQPGEISPDIDKSYYISSVATVKEVSGSHAITLLTCENGYEYIYDDNRSILKEIPWTAMFGCDEEKIFYVSRYDDSEKTYGAFMRFLVNAQKKVKEAYKKGEIDDEEIDSGVFYDKEIRKLHDEIPNIRALMGLELENGKESPVLHFIFEKKPTMVLFTKDGFTMKLLTKGKVTNVNIGSGKDQLFIDILRAYNNDYKTMCYMRISTDILWLSFMAYSIFKKVGKSRSKSKTGSKSKKSSRL